MIANAGVSAGTGGGGESGDQSRHIFAVNVDGVVNTVHPALSLMRARPGKSNGDLRGQIAIMSSIASFRGLHGAPAYCASKAAVRVWGEALRNGHAHEGIGVSVICPGFVRTPMTETNRFPMPFLMDAPRAARIVRRGLARGRGRIAIPWPMYALALALGALPSGARDMALRKLPKKGGG